MIRFNNDYNHGAHPAILKALEETNCNSYGGYGLDELCNSASEDIKKYLDCPQAEIHFLVGGTQTNVIAVSSALKSYQGILCADSGHINVHETGSMEAFGHKILVLPSENGKITAKQIEKESLLFASSPVKEHITQPKMVYISQPTEFGTVYSKKELEDLSSVCRKYGLFLFADGARLGYALGAPECDVTLKDLAACCDMFYIGGTKCGTLFGEALVITNPLLQPDFRSYIKQGGAMLAKGWLLGLQFHTLFKDGLYFRITENACSLAMRIKNAFRSKGIKSYIESPTNQQFVVVTESQKKILAEKYIFEDEGNDEHGNFIIRFCTSWSTDEKDVEELVKDIQEKL